MTTSSHGVVVVTGRRREDAIGQEQILLSAQRDLEQVVAPEAPAPPERRRRDGPAAVLVP